MLIGATGHGYAQQLMHHHSMRVLSTVCDVMFSAGVQESWCLEPAKSKQATGAMKFLQ